jgi:hypothetical protein
MGLSADSRLILVRIKIQRAKKHLADLESLIIESRGKHLHIIVAQSNTPLTGFAMAGPPPIQKTPRIPVEIISTAGDVVHSLRSALDHLAYQLAVAGTPGKEPSRRVEFPIAKDAATYEAEKARKVEGIRPETVKVIDALQPYKGGCHGDALWRIHELDNIDKHRAHFRVGYEYLLFSDWMPDYLVRNAGTPHFTSTEGFDPEVQEEMQFKVEEALNQPQIPESNALLPSLRQLVDFVDDLVGKFLPLLE